jgi:formamidopyrimidine-DNA glycosylase
VDQATLSRRLPGRRIEEIRRRSKYLLFDLDDGAALLVHLGMTGRFTIVPARQPYATHDHVALGLNGGQQLRFNDARRFGVVEYLAPRTEPDHRLLRSLGVEPLEGEFNAAHLRAMARGRRCPIKTFIMDARHVVGIGNIYASEALYLAGIHPRRAAGRLSLTRWQRLVTTVRRVLRASIRMGGTTLRDYLNVDGDPGRYRRRLQVYGRQDEPCRRCRRPIRRVVQSGRSTFYCPGCQV